MPTRSRSRRSGTAPEAENALLRVLDEAVGRSPAQSALHRLAEDVEHRLEQDAALRLAWAGSQFPLDARWLSIPKNVWHRPVMSGRNWVVVSFHTVPADSLIEELAADDSDPDAWLGRSETYAGRSAR